MSFIEFRSVTKTYERRPALSNFTLHVEQGERLVILGPSGCGKTTVLRLLAGLAVPDEGAITVADTVVAANGRVLLEPEKTKHRYGFPGSCPVAAFDRRG